MLADVADGRAAPLQRHGRHACPGASAQAQVSRRGELPREGTLPTRNCTETDRRVRQWGWRGSRLTSLLADGGARDAQHCSQPALHFGRQPSARPRGPSPRRSRASTSTSTARLRRVLRAREETKKVTMDSQKRKGDESHVGYVSLAPLWQRGDAWPPPPPSSTVAVRWLSFMSQMRECSRCPDPISRFRRDG